MTKKGPGKAHREGLTLFQIADMFSNEAKAERWIASFVWPDGPHCPACGSTNVQSDIKHKTMTHRCRDCPEKTFFSLRKGTLMEGSKLPFRVWAVGICLFATNIKGISSMRLHRELGISQKAAWFMLHRLRKAFSDDQQDFAGPVEVDETYMGGKRKNMSNARRKALRDAGAGRGAVGKTAVVGAKDRESKRVRARVVSRTDRETLVGFILDTAKPGATIYTDEAQAYVGMPFIHESVKHSVSEYVRGNAHTNGIESFWSMLARGYVGVYHKMSPKHLQRYISEFEGRNNQRNRNTIDQMGEITCSLTGKRLRYRELIADNGLSSGARRRTP